MNGSFSFMALILPFLFIHIAGQSPGENLEHLLQLDGAGQVGFHCNPLVIHIHIGKNINAIQWCSIVFDDSQWYSFTRLRLIRLASQIEPVPAIKLWTMISVFVSGMLGVLFRNVCPVHIIRCLLNKLFELESCIPHTVWYPLGYGLLSGAFATPVTLVVLPDLSAISTLKSFNSLTLASQAFCPFEIRTSSANSTRPLCSLLQSP